MAEGLAGSLFPAAAQHQSPPEFGLAGVPGLKTTRGLAGDDQRGTRDPPVVTAGLGEVQGC